MCYYINASKILSAYMMGCVVIKLDKMTPQEIDKYEHRTYLDIDFCETFWTIICLIFNKISYSILQLYSL